MLSPSLSPLPLDIELPTNEIHVWCASLDQPVSRFQRQKKLLSPDESIRAERFYFEIDRKRFIACHGILRTILGFYLGIEPSALQFCYGKNGKKGPGLMKRYWAGRFFIREEFPSFPKESKGKKKFERY